MTYERKWLTETHPVDVYIAEDGKEFDNRWDCLDHETGNKLADALSEAISNGYSEGSGKKFPYISFFGGLSDQNSNSSGYGAGGYINNKKAGDFSGLWN